MGIKIQYYVYVNSALHKSIAQWLDLDLLQNL
jgi:hypothetical protein